MSDPRYGGGRYSKISWSLSKTCPSASITGAVRAAVMYPHLLAPVAEIVPGFLVILVVDLAARALAFVRCPKRTIWRRERGCLRVLLPNMRHEIRKATADELIDAGGGLPGRARRRGANSIAHRTAERRRR